MFVPLQISLPNCQFFNIRILCIYYSMLFISKIIYPLFVLIFFVRAIRQILEVFERLMSFHQTYERRVLRFQALLLVIGKSPQETQITQAQAAVWRHYVKMLIQVHFASGFVIRGHLLLTLLHHNFLEKENSYVTSWEYLFRFDDEYELGFCYIFIVWTLYH